MSVKRNDPCPCGSGQKYKKCCQAKVTYIGEMHTDKLWNLYDELIMFYNHLIEETKSFFSKEVNEEIPDLIVEQHVIAQFFYETNDPRGRRTMLKEYIEEQCKTVPMVPSVRQIFKNWAHVSPMLLKLEEAKGNDVYEAIDYFSTEPFSVKIVEREVPPLEDGVLYFGNMLSFGDTLVSFAFDLMLPLEPSEPMLRVLEEMMDQVNTYSANVYMKNNYEAVVSLIFAEMDGIVGNEELEWEDEAHENVAELYIAACKYFFAGADADGSLGASLWHSFCETYHPNVRKPEKYAAGLHYFINSIYLEPTTAPTRRNSLNFMRRVPQVFRKYRGH
ncbi:SEC-C domain-containing protein [Bacillaceae bacterium SIJ1]|uniref:YecA family protein n=1 Tax=Litoribacterium kuwaitense TaxID=1398745 RepID=UPI0013EBF4F0|nr:SEC-C metal-binding domain-containing protein [Litoribacterium kuwaitense]NGP46492.1 SEC-C domain-containing protein [Litoribacterium kuwaitense]